MYICSFKIKLRIALIVTTSNNYSLDVFSAWNNFFTQAAISWIFPNTVTYALNVHIILLQMS